MLNGNFLERRKKTSSAFRKVVAVFGIFIFIISPLSFNFKAIEFTEAATNVNYEYINTDTVWTSAGSPYVVNSTLYINANLSIAPGVIVKFEQGSLIVNGSLTAIGDDDDQIIFTSVNDDGAGGKTVPWSTGNPLSGDWGAINVHGGRAVLDNVEIRYGGQACAYEIGVEPIRLSVANAGWCYDTAVLSGYGDISISNSEIHDNRIGIGFYDGSMEISGSKIYGNQGYGLTNFSEEQISAVDNWWGDDSGPYHENFNAEGKGDRIYGDVLFDPWVGKVVAPKRNPVILVPGVMASYLNDYFTGEEVWPSFVKMALSGSDNYLDALMLDEFGDNSSPSVRPNDIFRSIQIEIINEKIINEDFFTGLIQELKNNGYEDDKDLFVFPYDWRLNLNSIAGKETNFWQESLKEKIMDVQRQTGVEKVDVIAHSMGGIVVKNYISLYGTSSIDKFIDIATPHLGSPKMFKVLNYGDNLEIPILDAWRVKKISQNMPSAYQLLPSRRYFSDGQDFLTLDSYVYDVVSGNEKNGSLQGLDYNQSIAFLDKEGRNQGLLGTFGVNVVNVNDELHSRIDYLPDEDSYYNIIGCGYDTYAGVKKKGKSNWELPAIDGDGTVPLISAVPFGTHKYYTNAAEHALLPSANGVRQLVAAILSGKENEFDFSQFNSLREDDSVCGFSGTQFGSHSPVKLHAYDEDGNHTGLLENGDIEESIPGSSYDVYDEDQYVFLPAGHNYRIVNQATSSGELGITIEKIENSKLVEFAYFDSIKLTSASTSVSCFMADGQDSYVSEVDENGDGIIEKIIEPDSVLTGEAMSDLVPPEVSIIFPQEEQEISRAKKLIPQYFLSDDLSGVATKTVKTYLDGAMVSDAQIDLFGQSFGRYELKIGVTDNAGNATEQVVGFTLGIDIDGVISEIGRAYDEKMIIKKEARNNLIKDFENIKDFQEKYGQRIISEQKMKERAMTQCLRRNKQAWCEGKVNLLFSRIEYRLGKINQSLIRLKYELIIKKVELYKKLGWVTGEGYNIIKEDIDYLLSKIK